MEKMTFGIIITNRRFFPDHLVSEERKRILQKLENMGFNTVILSEKDTYLGAVETVEDAKKCADLFKKHQDTIDGIIVVLPNFGDEVGVTQAIDLSGLKVPVLVQACDDELTKMDIKNRRDAFCGKLSLCNNLYQHNIKFTNTTFHSCSIDSEEFTSDIKYFARVCRVVKGLSHARIGAIGQRPDPFHTVRFSEKLLQAYGITVTVVDLSEIIFAAQNMNRTEEVENKIKEIKAYGKIHPDIKEENIEKSAKLSIAIEKWVEEHECDATAIQCWDSIQKNYGCATCLPMSMMGEKGKPSACETDVMGALSMYALYLASGEPSALLDWNNNYGNDRDKCIAIHCSNYPKSFIATDFEISNLDILGNTLGYERCFGALKAKLPAGPFTFARISTDDTEGIIKAYVGEGEFTDDPVETMGGVAVCRVSGCQKLMDYLCTEGFEHHVAMNRSLSAKVLEEALGKYLGWKVYRHEG